jgi:hypothetical protein
MDFDSLRREMKDIQNIKIAYIFSYIVLLISFIPDLLTTRIAYEFKEELREANQFQLTVFNTLNPINHIIYYLLVFVFIVFFNEIIMRKLLTKYLKISDDLFINRLLLIIVLTWACIFISRGINNYFLIIQQLPCPVY